MRIHNKLFDLRNLESEVQDQIDHLESKLRKMNFRRDRKQFRKKMAKDPGFRATHHLISRIEQSMFSSELPAPGVVTNTLLGLWDQVK